MKTNKKLVLVVFMLGTLFNYANNDKDFNRIATTKKERAVFTNVNRGDKLIIKDEHGVQLHSKIIYKEGDMSNAFDLSALKDGKYTAELNKDYEIIVKAIEVKDHKVIFKKESRNVVFKPVMRNEENVLIISRISFDKKPMKIDLYFDDLIVYSETVKYSETTKNTGIVDRLYSFYEKEEGNYKVIVYNNDRSYIYEFKI
ncbi:hypothetical protein [Flavivirga jejuensis]|uniref:Uncharacterized protein n=1 Tax=Flavivirga jejuensis TaxID=870487 RepID=A0ABT8WKZ1_9FLAO|nr:hypothetical protein [Flavivirga jejuensis]MDO5973820.1 hypothetical protein [Flavivirga jejuensis]